ncbi:hypothetical protein AB6A40_005472 [Gnathostoma spinigerum]|uniref:Uncharacterized protein n=1 Tax=Gnathostoma spinigerum TaxID=75299 RepID=A0ABD6EP44_9BILA
MCCIRRNVVRRIYHVYNVNIKEIEADALVLEGFLSTFSAPDTTGDVTTTWGTTGSKTTSTDLNRTHLSSLPTATTSNVSRNHTKHSKRSVFVDEQRVFPKSDYVYNEEMSSEDYDETDLRSVQPTIRHTRTDG